MLRLFALVGEPPADVPEVTWGHVVMLRTDETLDTLKKKIRADGKSSTSLDVFVWPQLGGIGRCFFRVSEVGELRDGDVVLASPAPSHLSRQVWPCSSAASPTGDTASPDDREMLTTDAKSLLRRMEAVAAAEEAAAFERSPPLPLGSFLESGGTDAGADAEWEPPPVPDVEVDAEALLVAAALAHEPASMSPHESEGGALAPASTVEASAPTTAGSLGELRESRRQLEEALDEGRKRHANVESMLAQQSGLRRQLSLEHDDEVQRLRQERDALYHALQGQLRSQERRPPRLDEQEPPRREDSLRMAEAAAADGSDAESDISTARSESDASEELWASEVPSDAAGAQPPLARELHAPARRVRDGGGEEAPARRVRDGGGEEAAARRVSDGGGEEAHGSPRRRDRPVDGEPTPSPPRATRPTPPACKVAATATSRLASLSGHPTPSASSALAPPAVPLSASRSPLTTATAVPMMSTAVPVMSAASAMPCIPTLNLAALAARKASSEAAHEHAAPRKESARKTWGDEASRLASASELPALPSFGSPRPEPSAAEEVRAEGRTPRRQAAAASGAKRGKSGARAIAPSRTPATTPRTPAATPRPEMECGGLPLPTPRSTPRPGETPRAMPQPRSLSGALVVAQTLRGHDAPVLCLLHSATSSFLYSGSSDGVLKAWRLWGSGHDCVASVRSHPGAIRALAHLPATEVERVAGRGTDVGWVFSTGSDACVRIWRCGLESRPSDDAGGGALSQRWAAHVDCTLVAGEAEGEGEGECHALLLGQHPHGTPDASSDADGVWLACGAESGAIYLWPLCGLPSGAAQPLPRPSVLRGHASAVLQLAQLPPREHERREAPLILSASKDRSIRMWRLTMQAGRGSMSIGGEMVHCLPTAHRDVVRAVALVGDTFYSTGRDKTLRLWEPSSRDASDAAALDGRAVGGPAATDGGGVPSGALWRCARSLAAHTDEVLSLVAKPDGAWPRHASAQLGGGAGLVFSASRGGEVRIWDRESLVCLDAWVVHSSAIHALIVRDDCLLSAAGDGTIRVTRAAPPRAKGGEQVPPVTA